MIGEKEYQKNKKGMIPSVKRHNTDRKLNQNSCGGCRACHQKTRIHSVNAGPIFAGTGDERMGSNLQKPCAINFFQQNLGNSYLQSILRNRPISLQVATHGSMPKIQKKCASCGPSAVHTDKEEEMEKIQTKPIIGPADDVYEQEADRVTEQIMRITDSSVQSEEHQTNTGSTIQRISTKCHGNSLGFDPGIRINKSNGRSLSSSMRRFMESRFGVDLRDIRLHTDQDAHRAALQIQARAFTHGQHIWLGKGESEVDKRLMAHELTHVVQQSGGMSLNRTVDAVKARGTNASNPALKVSPVDRPRIQHILLKNGCTLRNGKCVSIAPYDCETRKGKCVLKKDPYGGPPTCWCEVPEPPIPIPSPRPLPEPKEEL